jgi:soluble lytic murein transglycosylase
MATKAGAGEIDVEDLFSPEMNVRLGTEYLADLGERFDNDPVLMLAGYNAGEKAAERWRERGKGLELDEFIEKISYRETRAYVKKVLRNYRNYLRLYGEVGSGTLRPAAK